MWFKLLRPPRGQFTHRYPFAARTNVATAGVNCRPGMVAIGIRRSTRGSANSRCTPPGRVIAYPGRKAQGAAIAEAKGSTARGTACTTCVYCSPRRTAAAALVRGRIGCLFEASSADALRAVNDTARLPYSRTVTAMDLTAPG